MTHRSDEAKAWRWMYNSKEWKTRRLAQLTEYPLCRFCELQDRVTGATVADHITPHKGDQSLFFEGAIQSLCKPCHDSAKQKEERAGFSTACDVDGYPIDPKHPSHGR